MVSWRVLATGAVVVLTLSAPAPLWAQQGGAGEKKILLALWRGITEPEVAFKAKLTELGIKAAYTEVVGANIDAAAKTVTVPASDGSRYFRLRSGSALTIQSVQLQGGNVVLKYQ